jgi:hypothetical protein
MNILSYEKKFQIINLMKIQYEKIKSHVLFQKEKIIIIKKYSNFIIQISKLFFCTMLIFNMVDYLMA